LLAYLIGENLPISEYRVQSENLEELFLRMTASR
jgi:hypothetical protein